MKIVYCTSSIRGLSGINKVTVTKVNALADIPGNEVYVIVTDNWKEHPLIDPLSDKVHFINLGINYFKNDYKSKLFLILAYFKCFKHWFVLQKQINIIKPDVIVSVSSFEKYVIPFIKTRAKKIRELHICSNHRLYENKSKFLTKILNYIDYNLLGMGFHKIVLLTKEDKETCFPTNEKFIYIHNMLTTNDQPQYLGTRNNIVISVGRLDTSKDFISLVNVWNKVCEEITDWKLAIIGEGIERRNIEERVQQLGLKDKVLMPGFSNNIHELMSEASVFAFTSMHEGFGLVITEAMKAGLPVISFAFQFGPRDIITEGKNGFLIENRNEDLMAKKIIEIIKNPELLTKMSEAAYQRAEDFSVSVIIGKWMELFKTIK